MKEQYCALAMFAHWGTSLQEAVAKLDKESGIVCANWGTVFKITESEKGRLVLTEVEPTALVLARRINKKLTQEATAHARAIHTPIDAKARRKLLKRRGIQTTQSIWL